MLLPKEKNRNRFDVQERRRLTLTDGKLPKRGKRRKRKERKEREEGTDNRSVIRQLGKKAIRKSNLINERVTQS